jgi:hypothetical protein
MDRRRLGGNAQAGRIAKAAPIGEFLSVTAPSLKKARGFGGVLPPRFLPEKLSRSTQTYSHRTVGWLRSETFGPFREITDARRMNQHQDSAKARPTDRDARWFAERRCGINCKQSREPPDCGGVCFR